ncbi:hypothetical protein [Synechococcus sp. EJ6-Ellesmere]|nr:hypothetical protein [Synechococcus sp. EJ6-Ellesmere]
MDRTPATAALIKEVEQRSGYPVQLLLDPPRWAGRLRSAAPAAA